MKLFTDAHNHQDFISEGTLAVDYKETCEAVGQDMHLQSQRGHNRGKHCLEVHKIRMPMFDLGVL